MESRNMSILTQTEIENAQSIIDKHPPGSYELKALYGKEWQHVASPTSFGKKFKNAVASNLLKHIEHDSLRGDNHNIYRIQSRS